MEWFVKLEKALRMVSQEVFRIGLLISPALDKNQPVRIVRAGEAVKRKATILGPRR
nr:hypothetical protein [Rhizobium leguminosarum]